MNESDFLSAEAIRKIIRDMHNTETCGLSFNEMMKEFL